MSDEPLEWNYGQVPVAGNWLDEMVQAGLVDSMQRIKEDLYWRLDDEEHHSHIGPQHRPGRNEVREACRVVRQLEHFRSLGRPAGRYVTVARRTRQR
jgi:hypothetical protein